MPSNNVTQIRHIAIHGSCLSALAAAWIAAARGHKVTVVQDDGMQGWRARVPGQQEHGEMLAGARRRASAAGALFVAVLPDGATITDHWRVRRLQPVDLLRLAAENAVSSYQVLAGEVSLVAKQNIAAIGDDLATAEAALLAASQGGAVTLVTTKPTIASDAHPGYREATKRKLLELGTTLVAEPEPDEQLLRDADLMVVGKDPGLPRNAPPVWETPEGTATAFLSDAYEPGAFTTCVYEAVDLALNFDA